MPQSVDDLDGGKGRLLSGAGFGWVGLERVGSMAQDLVRVKYNPDIWERLFISWSKLISK